MSDYTTPGATRFLPHALVTTTLVAGMPVAAVWWLRSAGVISSAVLCVVLALALALGASLVGSAYWKRRHGTGDLLFSELLLWGWLRRLRADRRLANAAELLGVANPGRSEGAVSVERSARLLRQLAAAVEAQDAYTLGHSRRVARHAATVARALGLPDQQVARIRSAAAVHDIGKLHVPREVINKPGRLTDAEFELAKGHAEHGAAMVACLGDSELTAIVRHHHERLDGTGYPAGLAAAEIPIGARIVAVADTFDAIISTRPYRPAAPHKRAIDVLTQESGTHLDPKVVQAFLRRYSGKRALALWATLAVLPQRALAWMRVRRGVRRPASPAQRAVTVAGLALLATAALAAPLASNRHQPRVPVRAPASPVVASRITVTTAASHHVHRLNSGTNRPVAVSPTSTCQAYNPQLCSALSGNGSAGGPSAQPATGSSGTLPFTGLDLIIVALAGCLLLAFGIIARRLSRAPGGSD